jgi:pimeloyl-ACP methyl ester carboxylesterase
MRYPTSDGVAIASYRWNEEAPGPVVVLHHGFGSHAQSNWVQTGVVAALTGAGRSVLAVDARGHGQSDAPHDSRFYGEQRMAQDLVELLGHLRLPPVDLVGYSMGAVVSLIAASTTPVARRLVAAGVGEGVIETCGIDMRVANRERISDALLAADPASIRHPGTAAFRRFAESTGSDLAALAAQARVMNDRPIALAAIGVPTLVLAGDADPLAVHPERLAAAVPGAQCLTVPGDHLGAVPRPDFADALVRFLA